MVPQRCFEYFSNVIKMNLGITHTSQETEFSQRRRNLAVIYLTVAWEPAQLRLFGFVRCSHPWASVAEPAFAGSSANQFAWSCPCHTSRQTAVLSGPNWVNQYLCCKSACHAALMKDMTFLLSKSCLWEGLMPKHYGKEMVCAWRQK